MVPGPDLPERPDRRRRQRLGRRDRAGRKGAGHIDAVEIDPSIQQIGDRRSTPTSRTRIRASRRTSTTAAPSCARTDKKYDLVVFALPDSLTLVSQQPSVRLESFLFTEQAFQSRPRPPGAATASSCSTTTTAIPGWSRSSPTCSQTPSAPRRWCTSTTTSRRPSPTARSSRRCRTARRPGDHGRRRPGCRRPDAQAGDRRLAVPVPADAASSPTTTSSRWRIVLIGALIAVAARGAGSRARRIRKFSPHFFVLGVAFLLLETRAAWSSFSLLFGTTWLVNALAFFGILVQRPA